MFKLLAWISDSCRKPERLFVLSVILLLLFRKKLRLLRHRQGLERMEKENADGSSSKKNDENHDDQISQDESKTSSLTVEAADDKTSCQEETSSLNEKGNLTATFRRSPDIAHANSSDLPVQGSHDPVANHTDSAGCSGDDIVLRRRRRPFEAHSWEDILGGPNQREGTRTFQLAAGTGSARFLRENLEAFQRVCIQEDRRTMDDVNSSKAKGDAGTSAAQRDAQCDADGRRSDSGLVKYEVEIAVGGKATDVESPDESQPSGSGQQADGGVQVKEDQPGSKEDMPPKRKRRTSRDDTKTKKTKEDTISMKNYAVCEDVSKPFSIRRCRSWFQQYAGKDDPETIGPEGIEKLCCDLAVDPENIVMLVIAWKLQAETLGFFKFTEWSKGMGTLECDSTAKLQARLGSLKLLVRDSTTYKKIYRYAFDFCKNSDQRTLDIDTSLAMLKVLLETRWPLLDPFIAFLQQSKYKVMNRDQWCNVLEFSRSIENDLSNYDEDGAWPVLMDEFVEWYRTNYVNQETKI